MTEKPQKICLVNELSVKHERKREQTESAPWEGVEFCYDEHI